MDEKRKALLKKIEEDVIPFAKKRMKASGFDDYEIKNVFYYRKEIELVNKQTKQNEKFKLYAVQTEKLNPEEGEDPRFELECLEDEKGNLFTINELTREYEIESFGNIGEVVQKTENSDKLPEKEREKYKKDTLEELKAEREQEEKGKEESKNDLTGTKPRDVMQVIDVDSTYIDNWTTVSRGFNLPSEVKQIAIATPMQKDDHILSSTMTMYMLDNKGNIIESVNGKTISDYFEIDDATGHNPMYDDNTKLELEGHAEKNVGQTMRRFKSKKDPDLYLSIEQKEVGGYHEVYAGGRTLDGNDPVEVQLETRNVGIQTDLEMQEIISTYLGEYNRDEMDEEADAHKRHGDDEEKIPVAHADGDEKTIVFKCRYIPGTDMTWEELSEETGEGIEKLQERFVRELKKDKEPKNIVEEIEYDYEISGHEHKHN